MSHGVPGPAGTRFREVRRFAELDSTNRYLLDEARAGAPEGLVVLADHQTAGRGRLGRRWEAPPGANLLLSVLLRPPLRIGDLHLVTAAMALAARSALRETTGVESDLKWPNDLLVGERKIAGILAETVPDGPGPPDGDTPGHRAVVVGIGLNVGWPPREGDPAAEPVPSELAHATSVLRESGAAAAPALLLDPLLRDLDRRLVAVADPEGRRTLSSAYRAACTTLGRDVTVSLPGETLRGRATDITLEGHLLVDVGACIRTITAGDVVHLRS